MTFRALLACLMVLLSACGAPTEREPIQPGVSDGGSGAQSLTLIAPTEGAVVSGEVELRAEVKGTTASPVSFLIDGVEIGQTSVPPYVLLWDARRVAPGEHLIAARLGTEVASALVTVASADNAPAIHIVSPSGQGVVCGTLPFEVFADNPDRITRVEFFAGSTRLGERSHAPFLIDWDTRGFPNGDLFVRAVATDISSLQSQAGTRVTVRNAGASCDNPPSVILSNPQPLYVSNRPASLSAVASDDVGVVKVQFFANRNLVAERTTLPYSTTWDPSGLSEGEHRLKVIAYDTANQTGEHEAPLIVDRTAPVITSLSPSAGEQLASNNVTLTVVATDAVGIGRVDFSVDHQTVGATATAPFTWTATGLSRGTHSWKATVTDHAGNSVASQDIPFTVGASPLVSFESPRNGDSVSGVVRLSVNAGDDTSTQSVRFVSSAFGTLTAKYEPLLVMWAADWNSCASGPGTYSIRAEATATDHTTGTADITVTVVGCAGPCSSRCDCLGANEICQGGRCKQAASDGSCVRDEQCPLGSICDITRKCVPGCAADCDCGSSKICNSTTLQCEACSRTNPCSAGESCSATGECVPATQCTNTSQCSDGQVCKTGICGFCTGNADCTGHGTGFSCGSRGLCESAPVCSDASCRSALGTPRAYCNTALNSCDLYECLSDTDCVAPATCNLTSKSCAGGQQCTFQTCQSTCQARGEVCEGNSCSCVPVGTRTGYGVLPDGSPCDALSCLIGSCVDSGDPSYLCVGGFGCVYGGLFALPICE